MALLRYFTASKNVPKLSDPNGPLSRTVPSTAIVVANKAVSMIISSATPPGTANESHSTPKNREVNMPSTRYNLRLR